MHARKYLMLTLLLLLGFTAHGCGLFDSPTAFTPPEKVEALPTEVEAPSPFLDYESYRLEEGRDVPLPHNPKMNKETQLSARAADPLDYALLKEEAPEDFLTLFTVPYGSLSSLSGLLQYEYGIEPGGAHILRKALGNGFISAVFTEGSREAELYYSEGEHHFGHRILLHGEAYLQDGLLFLPLTDLLEITGHLLSGTDPLILVYEEREAPYPALAYMAEADKRKNEGYYEALKKKEKEPELDFILLGDTTIATTLGRKNGFDKLWLEHGGGYFLAGLQEEFQKADMVIANLENVFTEETKGQKDKLYNMKAPRIDYIDVLPLSGITHVNIVNNHMVDFLEKGFQESLSHLEEQGIEYFGTNETFTDNLEIGNVFVESYSVFEKDGIKVGLLGYLGFNTSSVSDERIQKDIQMMREVEKVDYIVTSIHWGGQNTHEVTWKQKEMGRKLIDFGSDLVYGHHPHVLQEVEVYQGKPIYYSFGNFLFLDYKGVKDPDSILVNVSLRKDRFGEIHAEFTHKPLYWAGHTTKNLYTPLLMENEAHIRRALGKLKLSTTAPIDFSKQPSE